MSELDYGLLERALARLIEGLAVYRETPNYDLIRDGLIQRFEFTYELAHGTLRRYLEASSSGGESVDRMSFPTLIRTASEQGLLLNGWDVWEGFRKVRKQTSHTYNETAALEVVEEIPSFVTEVGFLVAMLKERPV